MQYYKNLPLQNFIYDTIRINRSTCAAMVFELFYIAPSLCSYCSTTVLLTTYSLTLALKFYIEKSESQFVRSSITPAVVMSLRPSAEGTSRKTC